MKVKVDINTDKILASYGLGASTKARTALASNVARRCDKYVPKDTGVLIDTAQVAGDGHSITYIQPYAAKQYTRNYRHSDPNRGPNWDKRMLANEKGQLLSEFETYLKEASK